MCDEEHGIMECEWCNHTVYSWEDTPPCDVTLHDYCVADALEEEVVTPEDFEGDYLSYNNLLKEPDEEFVEDPDPHAWVEDSSWVED